MHSDRLRPTFRRPRHRIVALLVSLTAFPLPLAGQQPPDTDALPEPLDRLRVLAGSWETDSVEFVGPDGAVRRTAGATAHNEIQLDGRVLVHRGRLDDPVIETRGWYWWDRDGERLRMGSVSSRGRYDEFAGGWEGDRLVMTTATEDDSGRRYRMTHTEITDDAYLESLAVSEDGGETWRTTSRQRMWRVGADRITAAADVLPAMDPYIGHWRTERKDAPGGEPFHFEYDLAWIDPGETIARLEIIRVAADGSTSTVFVGFKGRGPAGDGVYYHAASPSGRGGRGEVYLEEERLVTAYDGWTADGDLVEIRDVFEPVEDGRFVSRTYLRSSPGETWRQIGEDHWTRLRQAR